MFSEDVWTFVEAALSAWPVQAALTAVVLLVLIGTVVFWGAGGK